MMRKITLSLQRPGRLWSHVDNSGSFLLEGKVVVVQPEGIPCDYSVHAAESFCRFSYGLSLESILGYLLNEPDPLKCLEICSVEVSAIESGVAVFAEVFI